MDMGIYPTLPHVNFHRCSGGKRKDVRDEEGGKK